MLAHKGHKNKGVKVEKTLGDVLVETLSESLKSKGGQVANHCLCCGELIRPGLDFCTDDEPGLDICPDYSIFKTKEEK